MVIIVNESAKREPSRLNTSIFSYKVYFKPNSILQNQYVRWILYSLIYYNTFSYIEGWTSHIWNYIFIDSSITSDMMDTTNLASKNKGFFLEKEIKINTNDEFFHVTLIIYNKE